MSGALDCELFERLERVAALLGERFYGELTIRVENGKVRYIDLSRRLRPVKKGGAPGAGVTSEGAR